MPGDLLQQLVIAGPFKGIDLNSTDIYTPYSKGHSMVNSDCEQIPGSLVATMGRTNILSAPNTLNGGVVGYIAKADLGSTISGGGSTTNSTVLGSVPISAYTQNTPARFVWSQATGSTIIPTVAGDPGDMPFEIARVGATPFGVYSTYPNSPYFGHSYLDNYGNQTLVNAGNAVNAETNYTQFDPPYQNFVTGITPNVTPVGVVFAGTYTYAFTYMVCSTASTGTTAERGLYGQETSAYVSQPGDPTYGIVVTMASSITLTPSIGLPGYGAIPTDSKAQYQVCVYRSSLNQPTFFYVGNIASPALFFVDNSSDTAISANRQLTIYRSVPPVKPYGDFTRLGGTGAANAPITYFPGAPMEVHQGRFWYLATVQNYDTSFSNQTQLWYSNLERGWEFDKVNNVFLVDLTTANLLTYPVPYPMTSASNPYVFPNNMFLETPSALKSLASVLLFWTTKRMYVLYGNSPATYVFQKFADLGCQSNNSVAYAATDSSVGVFWMSENGIYFTNGQAIEYISEPIRAVIDNLTYYDRYNCVGFYANHSYWISFPNLGYTWRYKTTTGQWSGPLNYYAADIADVQACDPALGVTGISAGQSGPFNEVLAVRPNSLFVDAWFTQVDTDLGNPVTAYYLSNNQVSPQTNITQVLPNIHTVKNYETVGITTNYQSGLTLGQCILTVLVVADSDPTKTATCSFDLSLGTTQIGTLSYQGLGGGPLQGFYANVSWNFTTVAGNTSAPIQVKNVTVYGRDAVRNLTPTVSMG